MQNILYLLILCLMCKNVWADRDSSSINLDLEIKKATHNLLHLYPAQSSQLNQLEKESLLKKLKETLQMARNHQLPKHSSAFQFTITSQRKSQSFLISSANQLLDIQQQCLKTLSQVKHHSGHKVSVTLNGVYKFKERSIGRYNSSGSICSLVISLALEASLETQTPLTQKRFWFFGYAGHFGFEGKFGIVADGNNKEELRQSCISLSLFDNKVGLVTVQNQDFKTTERDSWGWYHTPKEICDHILEED